MSYKELLPRVIGKKFHKKEFNPQRILDSLRRETNISIKHAKEITENVCRFLVKADLKFISPPLIREIVNVELLRLGLEKARLMYTRIGFAYKDLTEMTKKTNPIFNYEKQQFENEISLKEVIFRRVITEFKEVKELIEERENE